MTIPFGVLPELPLAEYEFNFVAEQGVNGPAPTGSVWHGVFGKALRESVCFDLSWECNNCVFLHHCDYSFLFAAPLPPETTLMRHYQTIPVPHIFYVPPAVPAEPTVSLRLVLVGKANQKLPLVIQALKKAGQGGLGKSRCRLLLQTVSQLVPNGGQAWVYPAPKGAVLPPLTSVPVPAMPPQLVLAFLTPYRQSGRPNLGFGLPALFMAIVRRVSLLQYFYTDKQLLADFKHLKSCAQAAVVLDSQLVDEVQHRYSAQHGKLLDVSGVVGWLQLDLRGMEVLWPYLFLGQWLNVGKNASMGFGRYALLYGPLND